MGQAVNALTNEGRGSCNWKGSIESSQGQAFSIGRQQDRMGPWKKHPTDRLVRNDADRSAVRRLFASCFTAFSLASSPGMCPPLSPSIGVWYVLLVSK